MTCVVAAVESTTQAPDEPDLQRVFTSTEIDFIRDSRGRTRAAARCDVQAAARRELQTQSTKGGGAGTEAPYAAMTVASASTFDADRREK
jgi:hypothetical protein